MVLFEIFNVWVLIILRFQFFLQKGFVVPDALIDWNFSNSHSSPVSLKVSFYGKTAIVLSLDCPSIIFPTDINRFLSPSKFALHHIDHIFYLVRRDVGAPSCPYSLSPIDENHWDDWQVKNRLNSLIVLVLIVHNVIILLLEKISRQRIQLCEDISSRGIVLPSLVASTKLAQRLQEIYIVAAHKILSHRSDCHAQRLLSVMIG